MALLSKNNSVTQMKYIKTTTAEQTNTQTTKKSYLAKLAQVFNSTMQAK
ncbi:MAG: hypothetical protein HRT53_05270 [Colwellia sp.]|nr:hypothetical protein [Colwellia sp.]